MDYKQLIWKMYKMAYNDYPTWGPWYMFLLQVLIKMLLTDIICTGYDGQEQLPVLYFGFQKQIKK